MKDFSKKLFGGLGTSKDTCVTLIETYVGPRFPLDEDAKNLNDAMIRKNLQEDIDRVSDINIVTTPFSSRKGRPNDQIPPPESQGPTDITVLDQDKQERLEPRSQPNGQFSDAFEKKRAPSPGEEAECPLNSLSEAGRYLLESQPAEDPLGTDEYEPEGSLSSSTPTLMASQGIRDDLKDWDAIELVDNESLDGDIDFKKIRQAILKYVPPGWNGPNWVMGFAFLFMSLLYAYMVYQMREMSRGLR